MFSNIIVNNINMITITKIVIHIIIFIGLYKNK